MARIDAVKKGMDIEAVFQDRLGEVAHDIQSLLDRLLAPTPTDGERARPARLLDAMRYASLGGGKRLRPFLVVASAALFQVSRQNALMAGGGPGVVPFYSLVHDALPPLENHARKRRRPTKHTALDQAAAPRAGRRPLPFPFV